jgi:hypothetical protein
MHQLRYDVIYFYERYMVENELSHSPVCLSNEDKLKII